MHEEHRKRMREKYLNLGKSAFVEHEILEMLLFASLPRCDTNALAHSLIDKFGSFSGVCDADINELLKIKGVGTSTAFLLKLIPSVSSQYVDSKYADGTLILSSEAAFAYLKAKYVDVKEEMASVLMLNRRGKLIKWEKLSDGGLGYTSIDNRKLIELCLCHNATQVILCHNHPSGIAIPSHDDLLTTQNIIKALQYIGVRVVDHIVIADDDYVSMASSIKFMGKRNKLKIVKAVLKTAFTIY